MKNDNGNIPKTEKELEEWMQRNRIATVEELDARAAAYCDKKKGGVKQ